MTIININKKRKEFIMENDLKPYEWILPFLYLGSESKNKPAIKGSLLLFKEFFVFVKEIKPELDSYFKYIPYDYGPYSFELRRDLNSFIQHNIIEIVKNNERIDYYLTDEGVKLAKISLDEIDEKTKEKILKLRKDGEKLGYMGVLNYVYARYPEYTTASKIKKDIKCH